MAKNLRKRTKRYDDRESPRRLKKVSAPTAGKTCADGLTAQLEARIAVLEGGDP